jgi:small subunit ribosomal protein S6
MSYYETVFIARQDLTPAQVEDLTKAYSKIITDNGGKIHKTESWGLKNLSYRINKNRKGHFVLLETDAPSAAVQEMERNMRLSEDVLRYLTIKEEKLSTGPSIMMGGGSEDRPERSDRPERFERSDRAPRATNKEEAA